MRRASFQQLNGDCRMQISSGKLGLLVILAGACTTAPPPVGNRTPGLEGRHWTLAEVAGHPAHGAAGAPTLHLDAAQRRASGNTGCNGFSGSYELHGDSLRFAELISTRRACMDPEMNRQEGELMRALESTRSWTISGGRLLLDGAAGRVAFVEAHS